MKYYLLLLVLFMLPLTVNATTGDDEWLNQPVSINVQDEPLESVLRTISAKTDVTIIFDKDQRNNLVSIAYENITLQQVLNRIFSHQNKSFVFNNEKKTIIVKSFETKNYFWTTGDRDQLTFPAEMTVEEVEQFHNKQYQNYLTDLRNYDQVLENGMTRSELLALHGQQYKEYQNSKDDSNNDVIDNGMTIGQIHTMHVQQYKENKLESEDDYRILEDGITTRGELRAMHNRQYESYKISLMDNSELLENGMSKRELRAMHLRQYKEYKNRQKIEMY